MLDADKMPQRGMQGSSYKHSPIPHELQLEGLFVYKYSE